MIIRFCVGIASNTYSIIQQSLKCLEQKLLTQTKHVPDVQETFTFGLADGQTVEQKFESVITLFFSAYIFYGFFSGR